MGNGNVKKLTSQSTAQAFAHMGTDSVCRKRQILLFEVDTLEAELVALAAQTANVRNRKVRLLAMIDGLSQVVERRL